MQKKISILGCGWLGLPLAEFLISKNFIVKGSTASKEKISKIKNKLIEPFFVDLLEIENRFDENFLNSEILLINVPPSLKGKINSSFSKIIKELTNKISRSSIKNILFISSTGVYENTNNLVTEEGPFSDSPKAVELLESENIILNLTDVNSTILRFGGLYGYGRVPIRLSQGTIRLNSKRKLNLLHRDNACEIIFQIISKNLWNQTYNVCEDETPTQLEFYKKSSLSSKYSSYEIVENPKDYKIVSNFKIRQELGISVKEKILES